MGDAKRKLQIMLLVAISLTILAAPARGADWFGVHMGTGGFSLSFGSSNWAIFGSSWTDPSWRIDYHVALSGYGEWVWVDGLGQCWRPWVATGWRPYTHGRWVWTHLGWTWVAYEPWGYFPHHYGNWAMSSYGWVWTPGYQYRPANVVWVGGGGFVGWYACPPAGWSHAGRGWHRGYRHGYANGYDHGYSNGWHDAQHATYTRWDHFGAEDLSRHAVAFGAAKAGGSKASLRAGITAPDRDDLARRGIETPRFETESRTARVGDRQVTVTRPKGAEALVRRHAEPTTTRALAPNAQKTTVAREQAARIAPARGSGSAANEKASPQAVVHRPETPRGREPSPDRPARARSTRRETGSRQPISTGKPVATKTTRDNRPSDRTRNTPQTATQRHSKRTGSEVTAAPISKSTVRSRNQNHESKAPDSRTAKKETVRRARPVDDEPGVRDERHRRPRKVADERGHKRSGSRR